MLDVKVKIELTKPIGKLGFGIPLILVESATKDVEYIECSNLAEVEKAGFTNTTEIYKTAALIFAQDNAPKTIAVCATTGDTKTWLTNVDNVGKGWRQLLVVGDTVKVADIMTTIETLDNKMYFANLLAEDTTSLTVKDIKRTILFYCTDTKYTVPVAALVGATAGLPVGGFTYKNIILKGIEPQKLTDTQIKAIHDKGGITFVTKAGDNVTSEGKVAGGEYIDIVDSQDYIISNLEYNTQKVLNNMDKVPYDNTGIAILESVAVNVLRDAFNNGIIATNEDGTPAYAVDYATRENTEASDRAARKYIGGQFAFTLAGAIHDVEIKGEIII